MTYTEIVYVVEPPVLTITLSRPQALNAMTGLMFKELLDAWDRAEQDDDVRAIVVTGAGRAFCAGTDLSHGASVFDPDRIGGSAAGEFREEGGRLALRIFKSVKPVIAAINGPTVGIGASMTLPMDLRIAAQEARFAFPFTRRGITPESCSSWFLPRLVGISRALDWMISGRTFGAEEALAAGLVRKVLPADQLLPTARRMAIELTAGTSPVSVALVRRLLWSMLAAEGPEAAHRMESRALASRARAADVVEGVAAFMEKRPPAFPLVVSRDLPGLDWEDT